MRVCAALSKCKEWCARACMYDYHIAASIKTLVPFKRLWTVWCAHVSGWWRSNDHIEVDLVCGECHVLVREWMHICVGHTSSILHVLNGFGWFALLGILEHSGFGLWWMYVLVREWMHICVGMRTRDIPVASFTSWMASGDFPFLASSSSLSRARFRRACNIEKKRRVSVFLAVFLSMCAWISFGDEVYELKEVSMMRVVWCQVPAGVFSLLTCLSVYKWIISS